MVSVKVGDKIAITGYSSALSAYFEAVIGKVLTVYELDGPRIYATFEEENYLIEIEHGDDFEILPICNTELWKALT